MLPAPAWNSRDRICACPLDDTVLNKCGTGCSVGKAWVGMGMHHGVHKLYCRHGPARQELYWVLLAILLHWGGRQAGNLGHRHAIRQ